MAQTKLFIIGHNKTGTRSLHSLFENSGYHAIHWGDGDLAYDIDSNIKAGKDPILGYEQYDVFSDMEGTYGRPVMESYRYFRELFDYYPKAKFILNYRDVDDWLKSKKLHGIKRNGYPIYLEYYMKFFNYQTEDQVLMHWRRSYFDHISSVLKFFEDKPGSLIQFNLDRHDAADLDMQLRPEFEIDPTKWTHLGKTTWG